MSSKIKYTPEVVESIVEHNEWIVTIANETLAKYRRYPSAAKNPTVMGAIAYWKHVISACNFSTSMAIKLTDRSRNGGQSSIQQPKPNSRGGRRVGGSKAN